MHAWATVNEVTTITSARTRRSAIATHSRKSRWSGPLSTCATPSRRKDSAAWCQRGSSATGPALPCHWNARTAPSGVTRRSTVVTRCPNLRTSASMARRPAGPVRGYSRCASSAPCSHSTCSRESSGRPARPARADAMLSNARSEGNDSRTAATVTGPRVRPSSVSRIACASHTVAACRRAGSTRSRSTYPAPRVGTSTSRIAASGTRTSSETRSTSGFRNAWTVMSSGTSWAAVEPPRARRAAASAARMRTGAPKRADYSPLPERG